MTAQLFKQILSAFVIFSFLSIWGHVPIEYLGTRTNKTGEKMWLDNFLKGGAPKEEFLNKTLLVGVTYFKQDKSAKQAQYFGTIIRINRNGGIRKANSGLYSLESSGKIVVDPDYLATWICN